MTTTLEQIDQWCTSSVSEGRNLEFKKSTAQIKFEELCNYCVAIANEGGGYLVLGISDESPRKVVGTQACPHPEKTEYQIFSKLNFKATIEEVTHPNGRVLVLHIPSRPSGTAYQFNGKYLMRSGESLVPMSEDQLRSIFEEQRQVEWPEKIAKENLNAQQVIELLDVQKFFELLETPYPPNCNAVCDYLMGNKLIRKRNSEYEITNLCALLLARKLDNFSDISRQAARVVVYDGISKSKTKIDQDGTKGYAVGFQGMVEFVTNQLPQNEVIKDALRESVKVIPEVVIRELISNALIHQDLNIQGSSVMVEIYTDRVDISSPGLPVVDITHFIDDHQSRNEAMAYLMRKMRICEEKGSGIDRVVENAEIYQLPAPYFRIENSRTVVTIYNPKPFDEMDRNDRIRACYQHCVLQYIMNKKMTNETLRNRFNLPKNKSSIASQVIATTIEAKQVRPDDRISKSRKYAKYLPFWA